MKTIFKPMVFFGLLILGICSLNAEWIHLNSGVNDNLYGVNFVDENFGYAVGWGASSGAVALKTIDGGENWESTILSNNSFIFSVTTVGEDKAFGAGCLSAGSADAIFKTTNAGESWSYSTLNITYGMYDVEFPTPNIGYACGWLGKIFKTTNGGSSWFQLNSGTGNVLRWMYFVDENTGYIAGGSNWNNANRIYKTTNGGSNWSQIHNFGGGMVVGGIYFFNENEGIAVGSNGNEAVLKTYDGGANWEVKHTGTSSSILQAVDSEGDNCWAVGGSGRILYSGNFGETWILEDTVVPAATLLGVYDAGEVVYAVGTSGNIYRKELQQSPVSPSQIDFGEVAVGSSLIEQITITNYWDEELIGSIYSIPNFEIAGDFTVPAYESINLDLTFFPTEAMDYLGDIIISTSNAQYPIITLPVTGSGTTLEYFYGDIDDNGEIQAYDASIALIYAVGMDPIPEIDPLPWEDWRIITADVDGNEVVQAYDASLILQYAVGLIDHFPVEDNRAIESNPSANIIVNIDDDYLTFQAQGELLAFEAVLENNENIYLGTPEISDDEILAAFNSNEDTYRIALCSAYRIDNENYLKIPYDIIDDRNTEISLNMTVNTDEIELVIDPQMFQTDEKDSISSTDLILNNHPNPFKSTTTFSFNIIFLVEVYFPAFIL